MLDKFPDFIIKRTFDLLDLSDVVNVCKVFPDDQYLMKRMGFKSMIEVYEVREIARESLQDYCQRENAREPVSYCGYCLRTNPKTITSVSYCDHCLSIYSGGWNSEHSCSECGKYLGCDICHPNEENWCDCGATEEDD